MDKRQAVIDEAHRWLGAQWCHAARVRYLAVDCGQLLLDVYVQAGLIEDVVVTGYPAQWALHHDEERYLAVVERYARRIDCPLPGDIVVFKRGRTFSHGGIVVDWPVIIHADRGENVVLADASVGTLAARDKLFYSVFEG
ncbi:MAG: hypothetical protein PHH59_15490 [Methylovulum sp.]|uniref:hypothetical protein n=1 Tax=Methylovulum sp. TaxID=1916980 RepID=UPI0026030599|nr:hypothetical protein [Methylovulum sp.]MDD2725408.1 hypothetical protein [Methylovulum sp.]